VRPTPGRDDAFSIDACSSGVGEADVALRALSVSLRRGDARGRSAAHHTLAACYRAEGRAGVVPSRPLALAVVGLRGAPGSGTLCSMKRERWASLLLLLGACGRQASTAATPTAPEPSPPARAEPTTSEARVADWLDRAARAPHNGSNPELELAPELVREGAEAFQRAIVSDAPERRRDAASALSRHPEPATQRAFWLTQLESEDATVRFFATTSIAEVHAPEDFEAFVRATFRRGDSGILAARVRDFGDRRAVPILVDLLGGVRNDAENAALSLSMSPGVPDLPAEPLDPNATAEHLPYGAWRAPETSRIAPYRAWWQREGHEAFAAECTWWLTIAPDSEACADP
jgi:hypothetical protein